MCKPFSALKSGITLKLPPEALSNGTEGLGSPRLQLMAFRSSSFFIPEVDVPPQEVVVRQRVVSAVVQGRLVTNLTTPVEITIHDIEVGIARRLDSNKYAIYFMLFDPLYISLTKMAFTLICQ